METVIPKWQAKFDRSFPPEIVSTITNIPKTDTKDTGPSIGGIDPWLKAGVVMAVVGVAVYVIWKKDQDAKMRNRNEKDHKIIV